MAAGDITYRNNYASLEVLTATGTNAKPAGTANGTGGYPLTGNPGGPGEAFLLKGRSLKEARLVIRGIVTAGQILAGTYRLWGYSPEIADWVPLHAAVTIAESDTDEYTDSIAFDHLFSFTRFHLEAAATGTGAALTAFLTFPRKDRYAN